MKRALLIAAIVGVLVGTGGVLVLVSGVVPIKASAGHWAITEFLLQLGKRRSVATHTLMAEAPVLDPPWLVLKGAGHFEGGCRPCHGAPDLPRAPRVAQAMLPPPPPLEHVAHEWDALELAYIVEHGIKFTGMPAWPARHRRDEVRAVVAFLRALPELDAASYRRLVHGAAEPHDHAVPLEGLSVVEEVPRAVRTTCARCHGEHGRGRGSAAFPAIAGQRERYLRASLQAYAVGARPSGVMEVAIAGLSEGELAKLAAHYAALPARGDDALAVHDAAAAPPPDPAELRRGRAIATRGVPERDVPACASCHGPADQPPHPIAPRLGGQYADYLALQLELFEGGHRGGTAYAHLMERVARALEPDEMRAVAAWYAAQPGGDEREASAAPTEADRR